MSARRPVHVHVASILHAYTEGASEVEARGASLREVLADLDRRYPGLLFRIVDEQGALRPHIKVYLDKRFLRELDTAVPSGATVHILQALSGG